MPTAAPRKRSSKTRPVPKPRRRSTSCPPCPPCPKCNSGIPVPPPMPPGGIPRAPPMPKTTTRRSSRSRSRSPPPGGVAVLNLSQIQKGVTLKKRSSRGSTKKRSSKGSQSGPQALAAAAAKKRGKLKSTGIKRW